MKDSKQFLPFLGFFLAGLLVFFLFVNGSPSQKWPEPAKTLETSFEQEGVRLYFEKPEREGEEFTTFLILDPQQEEVAAADLFFSFDPEVLEPIEFGPGEVLENPILLKKEIDFQKGRLRLALASQTPVKKEGRLVNLVFRVKKDSQVQIRIGLVEEETKVGALGKTGNVLGESIDLYY